jgi:hypothetical protein
MAAKKSTKNTKISAAAPAKLGVVAKTAAPAAEVVKVTEVRNSPIPKESKAIVREITTEMIAKRAFEIHCGGTGGSEEHNWLRAERELRAGL